MERLTPRTCQLHNAIEGIACNKTMFLLQPPMKYGESEETWKKINLEPKMV